MYFSMVHGAYKDGPYNTIFRVCTSHIELCKAGMFKEPKQSAADMYNVHSIANCPNSTASYLSLAGIVPVRSLPA